MTIRRPPSAGDTAALEAARGGALEDGDLASPFAAALDAVRTDRITPTSRASSLLAAGALAPALIAYGIEELHARVELTLGRALEIEGGIYRMRYCAA